MRLNKYLLLFSSLGTLVLLCWAAFAENRLQEWRVLQRQYRDRLPAEQRAAFSLQLRQLVVPGLDVADRCVSCHLGMAPGESGIEGDRVFAPHPDVVHEISSYGCTVCHSGQGRATDAAAAHGEIAHWPQPMIPRRFAYAGCGACHTHLAVPNLAQLERGRNLFERYDCLACHALDGRGGTLRPSLASAVTAPDLSHAGAGGEVPEWYSSHLERHLEAADGPWRHSFAEVSESDRASLGVFLGSRVGAPGLVESKALFHSLGCRGCHVLGGVGGDDGPDLTHEGERDPGQLDFTHVPSEGHGNQQHGGGRSLSAWLAEHFRAPATLVRGSAMPALGLGEEQIEGLVFYMHSLRRGALPEVYWPRDRIRAERFSEREFATDGATLYGTFCAACHGPSGEGLRYAGMAAFPAVAAPDFLALASDDFLRQTVRRGRPGRRMPAWGELEGGLRPEEIDAVVAHLRALGGGIEARPDERPARWASGDPALGGELYAANCASCHGGEGEGGEGPALANRVLLGSATDTFLFGTIAGGRGGTSMPAFAEPSLLYRTLEAEEIEAIVTFIRTWEAES